MRCAPVSCRVYARGGDIGSFQRHVSEMLRRDRGPHERLQLAEIIDGTSRRASRYFFRAQQGTINTANQCLLMLIDNARTKKPGWST